ncbi:hypothetical protein E3N88_24791 [Mikania micrantha]|uniref:Ubiquitin-like protease family profile domain-containing protein n=1 Tax=Mikania micrantha TaxID=192012 RepID=A0A5N6MXK3_9ASTR|nr:hypothetical protein E3N88_41778 [Mikania micrantha]KAD4178951.1 hypothetical protein E3N88_27542 [Mikania micrantha]KAD4384623.1 hypothetical protein E3N88_24791 [Mikania micrantha]
MDKQYSSQPVEKPSKWILSKWRRPNFQNETSPDNVNEMQGEGSRSNETKQPQQIKKRKWAIPDDESEKWSKDVIEFFNNGDSPFCYSAVFFNSEKLDKRFWGTLLGYCNNGYLTPNVRIHILNLFNLFNLFNNLYINLFVQHIEGWAGRLINWRSREVQQGRTLNLRWTILPPSFVDSLLDSCNKNAIKFANGKVSPFPSFLDIDYVYFPLCFGSQDWSLIMIDLNSLDLIMYNHKCISGDRYRERIHPILKKIAVYFTALLVNIRYWKVKRRQESNITYGANDDYIRPENETYGNEALYVCMLMEHLVTGKPLDLADGFKKCCTNYRLFMAEQIYFWRCLPRPCNV